MIEMKTLYEPTDKPMSTAVFISGTGTNLISIYEEQKRLEKLSEKNYGRIDVVFTNAPNSKGALKAVELGISVISLSSKSYFQALQKDPDDDEAREYYDAAVIALLESVCIPDLIVLAGYRRRFSNLFISRYENRIINLYPGDTTKNYLVRGVDAGIQAIRAEEKTIKCTVFFQKAEERFGPALIQSEPISLEGFTEDDIEKIQEKVRSEGEWAIFPYAVHHLIAKGRVAIDSVDNIYIDGIKMSEEGYQFQGKKPL